MESHKLFCTHKVVKVYYIQTQKSVSVSWAEPIRSISASLADSHASELWTNAPCSLKTNRVVFETSMSWSLLPLKPFLPFLGLISLNPTMGQLENYYICNKYTWFTLIQAYKIRIFTHFCPLQIFFQMAQTKINLIVSPQVPYKEFIVVKYMLVYWITSFFTIQSECYNFSVK